MLIINPAKPRISEVQFDFKIQTYIGPLWEKYWNALEGSSIMVTLDKYKCVVYQVFPNLVY